MTARATSGEESTSPIPMTPSSVLDAHDEVVLAAVGDRPVEARLPDHDRFDVGDLHRARPRRDYR